MRPLFISLALLAVAPPLYAHDSQPANGDKNCGVVIHDDRKLESLRWSGACSDGFAEGIGVLEWKYSGDSSPNRYEGGVRKGLTHGAGYLRHASGAQYEGGFLDSGYHGTGTLLAYWGRYDGNWVAGEQDGIGKMVYTLGGSYEGQWKAGKFHGKGTVIYVGGRTVTAEFVEGRRIGQAPVPAASEKRFRLSEPDTFRPSNTMSTGVPFSSSYDDMSAEEKQSIRQKYVVLDDDDEPPYPAKGTKKIYQHIVDAQHLRLARGNLFMHVHIDSQGIPTSVTTYASPDPELTRWVSAVLVTEKYKPGICQGQPCAMRFPISIMFSADGDD